MKNDVTTRSAASQTGLRPDRGGDAPAPLFLHFPAFISVLMLCVLCALCDEKQRL